jgi:hypothetical protein
MARCFVKKGPIERSALGAPQLRRRSFTRVRQLTQAVFIGSGLVSAFGIHYFASAANLANSTAASVVTASRAPSSSLPAPVKGTTTRSAGHSTTTLRGHSVTQHAVGGRPGSRSSTTSALHPISPTSTVPPSGGAVTTTSRPVGTPSTVAVPPTTPTTLATPTTTAYVPPTTVPITTTTVCTTTPSGKMTCT